MILRNVSILLGVVLLGAIGFLRTHVEALPTQAAQSANMIVTTEWLGAHLDDPDVVVLATGSQQSYESGHIRGAGNVPHNATLGRDHGVLEPGALSALLAESGASDDARIVIYGENAMQLGWLYMAFASIGHGDHVSILSGNMGAWRDEGRPVSTGSVGPKVGHLTPRPAADVIVNAAWVRDRLEEPGTQVLDIRTQRERDQGYLPGSNLVLWQDLFADLDEMRFKSKDAIRALLVQAGMTPGQEAVTYCAVGMRASLMYFAARYVGIPARVYLGSWNDWRMQTGYPIVGGGA